MSHTDLPLGGAPHEDNDARLAALLHGKPVASLRLEDAPKGGFADVVKWAAHIFAGQGGKAVSPEIGEVTLDARAARNSMGHGGANAAKKVAFAAVKDVIEHGALVLRTRDGHGYGYYFAAPVKISGQSNIVTVLVHRDENAHRMYLHSVILKKFLRGEAVSRAGRESAPTSGGWRSGGISTASHLHSKHTAGRTSPEGIDSVLRSLLKIKPVFANGDSRSRGHDERKPCS